MNAASHSKSNFLMTQKLFENFTSNPFQLQNLTTINDTNVVFDDNIINWIFAATSIHTRSIDCMQATDIDKFEKYL